MVAHKYMYKTYLIPIKMSINCFRCRISSNLANERQCSSSKPRVNKICMVVYLYTDRSIVHTYSIHPKKLNLLNLKMVDMILATILI